MTRPGERGVVARRGPPGRSIRDGAALGRGPRPLRPPSHGELRRRYEAYCRRQAALLLRLVPEGGAARLHRKASEREGARQSDAFSRLATYCRELLPLPPFEAWRDDFLAHPARHLDAARPWEGLDDSGPSALAARSFDVRGTRWSAWLIVRPHTDGWTGWLTFTPGDRESVDPSEPSGCTGEIFREGSAERVVDRFVTFDDETLRAFLRSALP